MYIFCISFLKLQKKLSYNNTIVHRIVQDFVIQMGDVVENDGTGGRCLLLLYVIWTFPSFIYYLNQVEYSYSRNVRFEATVCVFTGLPRLAQLLTWLQVSDYRNFGTLKDVSFQINSLEQTIVSATETAFKMASTFYQKLLCKTRFLVKNSKFRVFRTMRFCSNFTMWYT